MCLQRFLPQVQKGGGWEPVALSIRIRKSVVRAKWIMTISFMVRPIGSTCASWTQYRTTILAPSWGPSTLLRLRRRRQRWVWHLIILQSSPSWPPSVWMAWLRDLYSSNFYFVSLRRFGILLLSPTVLFRLFMLRLSFVLLMWDNKGVEKN